MKRVIPGWKAKREVLRIGRQAVDLPVSVSVWLFSTPYYDLVQARRRHITPGQVPLVKKAAIYLIYPQYGLEQSHHQSLRYLISAGYAPVVVSNLRITPEDRAILLPLCYALIERPNVGYDFGGYRDGVLFLSGHLRRMDRLVLLNDSAWFPLSDAYDWLATAEGSGDDFVGAIWAWAVKHEDPEDYEKGGWIIDKNRRHFHYASFALSISANILARRAFLRFWRRYKLTQDKNLTVRRGEIGLTRWVVRHGYSHSATTELSDLPDLLARMTDGELRDVFDRLISITDPRMVKFRKSFGEKLESGEASRAQLEKIILCNVARQGASYAIADFLVRKLGFPFLKKSPIWIDEQTSDVMLELARSLSGDTGQTILREALALRAKRAPDFATPA